MSPTDLALIISAAGTLVSLLGTVLGVGIVYGTLRADIRYLKESRAELATKADLKPLELQLAEIKGAFTLTPVASAPSTQGHP